MYIGDIIKNYRIEHQLTVDDFAEASKLPPQEIEVLEGNFLDNSTTPVSVAIRQIKAIAETMQIPMPVLMSQIPSDQPVVVQVVAESDQPHAK